MEAVKRLFGVKTLYDVLGVPSSAPLAEILKAYRRKALATHPDRCPDDPLATERFQMLIKIHETLSSETKRKLYDQNGLFGDDVIDLDSGTAKDWYDYYRAVFAELTADDIDSFSAKYKGSAEEREDVRSAYETGKGSIDALLEHVPLSKVDDVPRFVEMIDGWIQDGSIKAHKAYSAERNNLPLHAKRQHERIAAAVREAKALEKQQKKRSASQREGAASNGGDASLQALIKARQAGRGEHLLEMLAAKYGSSSSARRDGDDDDDGDGAAPRGRKTKAKAAKAKAGSKARR